MKKRLYLVEHVVMNPDFENQRISRIEVWEEREVPEIYNDEAEECYQEVYEGIISGPRRIVEKLAEVLGEAELQKNEYLMINIDTKDIELDESEEI